MIRPIVVLGDPVLSTPTTPVESVDKQLVADMFETMYAAEGVGLAANQIGLGISLFVFDCEGVKGVVANPALETSDVPETMPSEDDDLEGCLSLPGEYLPVGRADWAKVTGIGEDGEPVTYEGTGFLARCFQHECGHLDGHVYTDVTIGRYKREAKRMIRDHNWKVPGVTWLPDPDAPGFQDETE
ncbi:MAG: peptide deformylase [Corynebacterium sp.]|nr:peptide deformylase [Corynebacterium sp.]